jgi:hypothetical protein
MKCDAWVRVETKRRKGSGAEYTRVKLVYGKWRSKAFSALPQETFWELNPIAEEKLEGLEECGGDIEAEVEAVDEPYFGGSSATLEINYKCVRCGNPCFFTLPNCRDTLSALLTRTIATLPQPTPDGTH